MYMKQQTKYVYGYGWTPGLILACDSSTFLQLSHTHCELTRMRERVWRLWKSESRAWIWNYCSNLEKEKNIATPVDKSVIF